MRLAIVCMLAAGCLEQPAAAAAAGGTWSIANCPPRLGAAAVLDAPRNRVLVFGGFDGIYRDDLWALSLDGLAGWTRIVPAPGAAPAGRSGHTLGLDPVRDRLVLFGGTGAAGLLGDAWVLPLAGAAAWTRLQPQGSPSPRSDHAAAIDPQRDRLLVFGGWDHPTHFLAETWALSLDGTRWELLAAANLPTPRKDAAAAFDAAHDRLLVFGGFDTGYRNDVWQLVFKPWPAWTPIPVAGDAPSPRRDAVVAYDPVFEHLHLFGGLDGGYRNDAWDLGLELEPKWSRRSPAGTAPAPRSYHAAAVDAAGRRTLVFGGYNGAYLDDTWALAWGGDAAWARIAPAAQAPAPRLGHAGVYDPVGRRMIVFGGYDGAWRNETWQLGLTGVPEWMPLVAAGPLPLARIRFAAAYDPVRRRMIVHGGLDAAQQPLADLWALSLDGAPAWTQIAAPGAPPARANHSLTYDPVEDRLLVFGGTGAGGANRSDAWALKLSPILTWEELPSSPEPRGGHVAFYDPAGDRLVAFGGWDPVVGPRGDLVELALHPPAWQAVEIASFAPPGRAYASLAFDVAGARAFVFGGYDGVSPYRNDLWELALDGKPAWQPLAPEGAPPAPRGFHAAVFDAARGVMQVFGGGGTRLGDTWTYTPEPAPAAKTRIEIGAPPPAAPSIFDVRGRRVTTTSRASGIYWIHLAPATRRMVVVR